MFCNLFKQRACNNLIYLEENIFKNKHNNKTKIKKIDLSLKNIAILGTGKGIEKLILSFLKSGFFCFYYEKDQNKIINTNKSIKIQLDSIAQKKALTTLKREKFLNNLLHVMTNGALSSALSFYTMTIFLFIKI